MNLFENSGLSKEILSAVKELGFESLTPIQSQAIPHLLTSKQDLVASAQTGTGKTAAFGLPAIQLTNINDRATQTLVLCPTRELCLQITKDLQDFSKYLQGLNVLSVYGGASIETQIKALSKGAQVVVATPGRAKDLINRKKLKLNKVERVVLDEADEMLAMGFRDDINEILREVPEQRQTLLFFATMSKEISGITKKFMKDPLEVSAAPLNTGSENVKHQLYMVHPKDRYEVLKRIVDINPSIYGIVFCRTRRETKDVAFKLIGDGYDADLLNGDLSQAQRDEVMAKFRSRQLQILVATDVAARGLDVNDLTHVINFNLPDDDEVYIHRSGRTGRAGKTGVSVSIITVREARTIRDIEKKAKIVFSKEQIPTGKDICSKQLYSLIDKIEKVVVDEKQIEPFLKSIYAKLEWLSREELIKHFVSAEFNRFLSYYKNRRDIHVAEDNGKGRNSKRDERPGRNDRGDRRERDGRSEDRESRQRRSENLSRLFINLGSTNKLNPARLIGLINESLDSNKAEIGKIEVLRNFSFFEVQKDSAVNLLTALNGQTFEGIAVFCEPSAEKAVDEFSRKPRPDKKNNFSHKRSGGFKGRPGGYPKRDSGSGGGNKRRGSWGRDRRN